MNIRIGLALCAALVVGFGVGMSANDLPRVENFQSCSDSSRLGMAYQAGMAKGSSYMTEIGKQLTYQQGLEDGKRLR